MTLRKYLVLAGVTVFGAAGDAILSRGMKEVGNIAPHHVSELILAILNPWVAIGGHYDHLGSIDDTTWFSGANDNASGIAMLLGLARHFKEHPLR